MNILHVLTKEATYSPCVGQVTHNHGLDSNDPDIGAVEKVAESLNPIDAEELRVDAFCCHLRKHAQSYIDAVQPAIESYTDTLQSLEKQAFEPVKTLFDHTSDLAGGGFGGTAAAMGTAFTPYVGTGMAIGDTFLNGANVFASGLNWKDRLGYAGMSAANLLGAGVGLFTGGAFGGPAAQFFSRLVGGGAKLAKGGAKLAKGTVNFAKGTKAISNAGKLTKGMQAVKGGIGAVDDAGKLVGELALKYGDDLVGSGSYAGNTIKFVKNTDDMGNVITNALKSNPNQKLFATLKDGGLHVIDTRTMGEAFTASKGAKRGFFNRIRDFNRWTGDTSSWGHINPSTTKGIGRTTFDNVGRYLDKQTKLGKGWKADLAAKGWKTGLNPIGLARNAWNNPGLIGKRLGYSVVNSPMLTMGVGTALAPAPYYVNGKLIKSDTKPDYQYYGQPNAGMTRGYMSNAARSGYRRPYETLGNLGGAGYNSGLLRNRRPYRDQTLSALQR